MKIIVTTIKNDNGFHGATVDTLTSPYSFKETVLDYVHANEWDADAVEFADNEESAMYADEGVTLVFVEVN